MLRDVGRHQAASWGTLLLAGLLVAFTLSPVASAAAPPPDDSQPLPSLANVSSLSHVDPRLSAAASRLAGHPVVVRCLNSSDWYTFATGLNEAAGITDDSYTRSGAYTSTDHERITWSPNLCALVARFTYTSYFPYAAYAKTLLANAIVTLAHESEHAAGHPEEAVAECYGQQMTAPLAKLLRSTMKPANARLLARLAWTQGYPRLPGGYRSPDCRDGGPLDLNPISNVWP